MMISAALGVVLATVAASTAALTGPASTLADPFEGLTVRPWFWGNVSTDGRTVGVPVETGSCDGRLELLADERPDRVVVAVVDRSAGRPNPKPCTLELDFVTLTVGLHEPLAGRPVVDAANDQARRILDLNEVLSPAYPSESEIGEGSVSQQPTTQNANGLVWTRRLQWVGLLLSIDQFGAAAPVVSYDVPVRQVPVRGQVGTVSADAGPGPDGRWASHETTLSWTEGAWRFRVSLGGIPASYVDERLPYVLRVAESLH